MQKDIHALWHSVLGEVELTLSDAHFVVYWSNTKLVHYDENEAIFEVPNVFIKKQFETELGQL